MTEFSAPTSRPLISATDSLLWEKYTEQESGSGGGGSSSELDVGKGGVWWILKMNPFLLASYNRRKKAASLLLRSAAVGV